MRLWLLITWDRSKRERGFAEQARESKISLSAALRGHHALYFSPNTDTCDCRCTQGSGSVCAVSDVPERAHHIKN